MQDMDTRGTRSNPDLVPSVSNPENVLRGVKGGERAHGHKSYAIARDFQEHAHQVSGTTSLPELANNGEKGEGTQQADIHGKTPS